MQFIQEQTSKLIQDDLNAQLRTKLAMKAETLKELQSKKQQVQSELEGLKKEIRELNLRYKDRTLPNGMLMDGDEDHTHDSKTSSSL